MLICIIATSVQVTTGLGLPVVSVYLRLRVAVLFAQRRRHFYRSLNVAGQLLMQWLRRLHYEGLFLCFRTRKVLDSALI